MEKFLIDYEIMESQEAEKSEGSQPEDQEREAEKERVEKARIARNKANKKYQNKEYEQINIKLPKGLKKAFLLACKEKGISGRQYIIDCMRELVDTELDRFIID